MNINFLHLRAFTEVAKRQSFTVAAERLHLTQPAVSKAVALLEAALGLALLERTTRQVTLTDAGTALYDHARSIFALEQAALEDMAERRGVRRGTLSVGASTTIAAFWLPPYLGRFMTRHPSIRLRETTGNTEAVARQVLDGEVEIALVEGPVDDPRLDQTLWHEESLVLVAPHHWNIVPAALSDLPWVVREDGSGTAQVVDRLLAQHAIVPRRQAEVSNNLAALQLVLAGAGVSVVPRIMAQPYLEDEKIQEIFLAGNALLRPLTMIRLKGRPASPARLALEALLAVAPGSDL